MKVLFPFLTLCKRYSIGVAVGVVLSLMTLLASLFLLALSGWLLAATAAVGVAGIYSFNYMLPAVGIRGAALLRTTARYAERLVSHDVTFRILAFLRTLSFKKILQLNPAQLQFHRKSDLLNLFIADIDNLNHLYLRFLSPLVTALLILFTIYFSLSYFHHLIAIVITATFSITLFLLPSVFYRISKPIGETLSEQKKRYRQQMIVYLQGQSELAIFNSLNRFRATLNKIENSWITNQKKQSQLIALSQSLVMLMVGLLTITVIWLSMLITFDYHAPIIALFVFVSLAGNEFLMPVTNSFIYLGQVLTSAQHIDQLFNQKPTLIFNHHSAPPITSPFSVTMKNIFFRYPQRTVMTFNNLSLTIKEKQHVALVGKSGSGKSTLLKLITRWADPDQGEIYFNNTPITHFSEKVLRRMIAVVPQRIDILSDTLLNNLRIANQSASDEKLVQIMHQVGLSKLIDEENGLAMWLGDSGRTLSGGEIRRIGIARALLHDAPLILMDEPTESLDNKTEQRIIALIKNIYQNKTLIMVTHKLINNYSFDRVYSIDENRDIENNKNSTNKILHPLI